MAYDKQNFKSGQKLMAAQLNAMDNAIGNNDSSMDNVALQITAMNEKLNKTNAEKIDGAYVENGYLFLTSNGEVVVGNLGPFSGGGSSGGTDPGNTAKLTVKNVSGWLAKSVAEGQECKVAIDWSSIEDGLATGNGTIKIVNNGVSKASYDITQGSIVVDLTKYIVTGSNSVKITISDVYDNSRTINFSITVVSVSLTSTFDDSVVYDGDINFVCTPIGNIKSMYAKLRSAGTFSYDSVEKRFEDHQSKWSEAIFNEDAYFKYIQPLLETGTSAYLAMLQGSKEEQRKWWLYNRFRYLDSKYNAGDAVGDIITLRGYAKGNITIRPYADIYATVKYGSYLVQQRATRGQDYTLVCPLDNVNDTEIYVYSCSQISEIGDISPLKVGYADFSLATKLSSLKIGDSSSTYSNTNLKELYLGNNTLLKTLDVRNCPNLTMAVDVSKCSNVEEVYFDGTSISALSLPNGGNLKKLHLPNTITNLTLRNQTSLTEFVLGSYSNISTLWIENIPSGLVNPITILEQIKDNSRVRVIGFTGEMSTASEIETLFDKFDTFRGIDEHGNNTDKAQVSGTIHVNKITSNQLKELAVRYPDVSITYDVITFKVEFYNSDVLLDTQYVEGGKNVSFTGTTPSKAADVYYTYTFSGWTTTKGGEIVEIAALRNVTEDRKVYAVFAKTEILYTVKFVNGSTVLQTGTYKYGETPTYNGSTPVSSEGYEFRGWNPEIGPVTGDITYAAAFKTNPKLSNDWDTCDAYKTVTGGYSLTIRKLIFKPDATPETYDAVSDVGKTSTPVKLYAVGEDIIVTWSSEDGPTLEYTGTTYQMFVNKHKRYVTDTVLDVSGLAIRCYDSLIGVFYGCTARTIIGIENWDLDDLGYGSSSQHSSFASLESMFRNCWVDSLNISNWNTKNVKNMYQAFAFMPYIQDIDISGWNMSNVTNMNDIFRRSSSSRLNTITIPKTNGNGIANTEARIYGANENIYFDLSTLSNVTIIIAS